MTGFGQQHNNNNNNNDHDDNNTAMGLLEPAAQGASVWRTMRTKLGEEEEEEQR